MDISRMRIISKKKVMSSWIWVLLYSIVIFLSVPLGNTIQRFVSDYLRKEAFSYFVLFFIAVTFIYIIYLLTFRLKIKSFSNYTWILIIAGIYIYFTLKLPNTIETVHFLEYGLLSYLMFKALSNHIKNKSIYFTATLFVLLVGTFDEILQWITPHRMWDFHDVWFNALSGGLFQILLWKGINPKFINEKINAHSIKILTSTLAICIILLGLCVSNTPKRVALYTKRIPLLSFLQKEESMSEFGHEYRDPAIGVFYSRLSSKKLQEIDRTRGKEYAEILNESINKDYEQFLKEYNPISNPFLHELRIHVFRRNKYFKEAKVSSNSHTKKDFYFIAYKENLILKKYFTQTIQNSVYRWDDNIIKELRESIDEEQFYESPVSNNLFTAFSEKSIWIAIFALIILLLMINIILHLRKRTSSLATGKRKEI